MDLCIVQENTAVLGSGQQVVGTLRASHATKQWLGNQEAFNGDYHIVENSEPSLLGIDCENTPENADTVYCIQGNTIDRSDTAGANGKGVNENISFSLNTIDRHVVATASGIDCRNGTESKELSATLQAHKDGGYSLNATHPVRINQSVRRLTPTECARLQGMPDWWLSDIPHSDSAAYKIWGNGMAAPCVLYIMRNIVETINQEENNGKENI
jgi:site-specific DNA-cytosine methylase